MNFMNKLAGNEYVGFSNATWVEQHIATDQTQRCWRCFCTTWAESRSSSSSSVSQFPVRARVWRQKLCHRLLPEGEEGKVNVQIKIWFVLWSDEGYLLVAEKQQQLLTVFLFLQCFPEGTDMTSILDFYFQVSEAQKQKDPNFVSRYKKTTVVEAPHKIE